ncbi:MAG: hypothetical protein KH040_02145 [Collinsella sp.]|nr:hypothetical protein [Collinsella sp.]
MVVRDGANGSVAISGTDVFEAPAFKVEVEDTIGAGDVYNAGFVAALLEGGSLQEALEKGNAVSGYTVARQGARNTPTPEQLAAFIDSFN